MKNKKLSWQVAQKLKARRQSRLHIKVAAIRNRLTELSAEFAFYEKALFADTDSFNAKQCLQAASMLISVRR